MLKTLPPSTQLLWAYSRGFFPMPAPNTEEIEWFRPDPRAIFPLDGFHVSRSLQKHIKRQTFSITLNQAFSQVISFCAGRPETWINAEFQRAYSELHYLGHAHSVEAWSDNELAGGVYGVQLGGAFFAESMFSLKTNASKIALYELIQHLKSQNFCLLEIQFLTPHLASLGATEISDTDYQILLKKAIQLPCKF